MSERELIAFFRKPTTGSVCGRFQSDQLNHELEIPKKRIPWVKYFFQFAIPAFLVSSKAAAQGEVRKVLKGDTVIVSATQIIMGKPFFKKEVPPVSKTITGRVVDEKGEGISFATFEIDSPLIRGTTDSSGHFSINPPSGKDEFILKVSSLAYVTRQVIINKNDFSGMHIIALNSKKAQIKEKELVGTLGMIVVGGVVAKRKPKLKCDLKSIATSDNGSQKQSNSQSISFIQRIFKDSTFKNFKFYPNPAASGSNITIEWKKPEAGDFEIQLLNQNGQLAAKQEINDEKETRSLRFNIPAVAAGTYFLLLTNRKSGKKITEKIIIQ
jgi:hypothetical protein